MRETFLVVILGGVSVREGEGVDPVKGLEVVKLRLQYFRGQCAI